MTTQRSGNPWPRTGSPPRLPGEPPHTSGRRPQKPQATSRRRIYRVAHLVTLVLAPVVLLSLAAAIIIYVRLLHGPVSLKSFGSNIEASINADLDGFTADIDDAVITLADDYRVELRLINLRVSDLDGDLVASAPMASVELDKSALWRLSAAPERVFLIEPRLAVTYTEAQGFALSISDTSGSTEASPSDTPKAPAPVPASRAQLPAAGAPLPPSFHRIDVARIFAESTARARRGGTSSRIREFGVRNATVSVAYDGQTSDISVTEASVDLEHLKRRSVISGSATIASEKGPWSISFRTEETDRRNLLKVTTTVHDFVPSTLAKISPALGLLGVFDTPMTGELALDLTSAGDLKTATLGLDLARGFVRLPSVSDTPLLLDGGRLAAVYDADAQHLTISPSTLDWGGSRITVEGALSSDPAAAGEPQWHFGLKSINGVLSAEDFGIAPIPIESFKASGRIIPGEGLVQLAEFFLKAGGGEVRVNGEIITGNGAPSTRVDASVTPMPLATLKAMWPRAVAPAARTWVGTQVTNASLQSASLKLLSGRFLDTDHATDGTASAEGGERLSASIEISDLRMHPLPKSLPIQAPRATIRLENSTLEVTVPEAAIIASETRQLPLKEGRLTIVDVRHDAPIAELALKSQAPLAALIDTLNHSELHLTGQGPLPIDGVDGKVDGEIKISMPLVSGSHVVKAEGKARITDLKGKSKEHKLDLQGGTIDISVSDIGVIAKGDMIVNGVLTRFQLHRILDAPPDMQPPIRISATLDNSDRTQLGLDLNHMVQGPMAVEVTFAQKADAPPAIHLRADLTNAELLFPDLAWRKAPGRIASLEFDVEAPSPNLIDLKNFRLVGDTIAIDGWLKVDDSREVSEFYFPNFSINVVSRLEVKGKINANKVWAISAKGSTFDARDLFTSLLSLNGSDARIKPLHPSAGVDLTAEIDTVIGHGDVSLRNYKMKTSERSDRLVAHDGRGTLDGGKPLAVLLKADGPRKLYAESADAGQAFKLSGFYPNMLGGRVKLEVDLEGRGAAEKSGILWVEDFRVLGDPIISEVYSSAETSGPGDNSQPKRKKQVEREAFDFQRMKVPFSIGHGQFVLDDSYIRGPLLGASIRGKVDYNNKRISLGGTYVPLQGINAAVCDIPLVGPLVAGFDCQGVFGITYAIQGSMAQPQVLVNPLSMFTPGILRGIMEMTSPNPQVQPLREQQRAPADQRVRASSSSAADGDGSSAIDGWSSETTPAGKKK
ncbi:AsmA-like C-terminal region-containing protein [Hyphomicrobium sp.]|uniref:YhdP family protein n=1 Tax=Hyphomicrobium sp. TaxID=82 RepID=UPI002E34772B|nr:AsmA-like C-terminal region-containing protein [Hyphomicrobium sp.]HEX2840326.1 AsmA-like C-terminal region-containing protein [Hyphomicrobium sp.]